MDAVCQSQFVVKNESWKIATMLKNEMCKLEC
jgi:hypothetical protein